MTSLEEQIKERFKLAVLLCTPPDKTVHLHCTAIVKVDNEREFSICLNESISDRDRQRLQQQGNQGNLFQNNNLCNFLGSLLSNNNVSSNGGFGNNSLLPQQMKSSPPYLPQSNANAFPFFSPSTDHASGGSGSTLPTTNNFPMNLSNTAGLTDFINNMMTPNNKLAGNGSNGASNSTTTTSGKSAVDASTVMYNLLGGLNALNNPSSFLSQMPFNISLAQSQTPQQQANNMAALANLVSGGSNNSAGSASMQSFNVDAKPSPNAVHQQMVDCKLVDLQHHSLESGDLANDNFSSSAAIPTATSSKRRKPNRPTRLPNEPVGNLPFGLNNTMDTADMAEFGINVSGLDQTTHHNMMFDPPRQPAGGLDESSNNVINNGNFYGNILKSGNSAETSSFINSFNVMTAKKRKSSMLSGDNNAQSGVFPSGGEMNLNEPSSTSKKMSSCKTFRCNQCKRIYPSLNSLCEHTFEEHGSFKCTVCDSKFTQRSNLQRHALKHVGFKPFECVVCKKAYYRKDHSIRHVEVTHPQFDPKNSIKCHLTSSQCLDYLEEMEKTGRLKVLGVRGGGAGVNGSRRSGFKDVKGEGESTPSSILEATGPNDDLLLPEEAEELDEYIDFDGDLDDEEEFTPPIDEANATASMVEEPNTGDILTANGGTGLDEEGGCDLPHLHIVDEDSGLQQAVTH